MEAIHKHSIVEEAKGQCSVTVAGAPLGYFEERLQAFVAQGITSTLSLIAATAQKNPDSLAVMARSPSGFKQFTYQELLKAARQLAQGLCESSMCPESVYNGKKIRMIAIFLDDCIECFVADFAAQYVPAVTVFLNPGQKDMLLVGLTNFPFETIIINAVYCELVTNYMEQKKCRIYPNLVLIEEIPEALKERLAHLGVKTVLMSALQANNGDAITVPKVQLSDPITMLATSGSTGQPKFVMAPSRAVLNMFAYGWGTCLPPGTPFFYDAHYYYSGPRMVNTSFLAAGNPLLLSDHPPEGSIACLREKNPGGVTWLPYYMGMIYDYVRKAINERPEAEARRIWTAIEKKIAFIKATKQLHHEELDKELQEVRTQFFGTGLKFVFWGGTLLPEELRWFFSALLGCPLIGFYGQLEVGGTIAIQDPLGDAKALGHITPPYLLKLLDRSDIGYSVDDVIDGKKCPRGELLVKGPVCLTYFNKDDEYKKLFYEGEWFRTNDIMQLDLETLSFRIIDRGNNILRPLTCQFIPVTEHERIYEQSPYVRQICVYIENISPSILAIIAPNEENLLKLAGTKGVPGDVAAVCRNETVLKEVLANLRELATKANVVEAQQIIGVILSPSPFSVENKLLTMNGKICRMAIYSFYKDDILALRKQLEASPAH